MKNRITLPISILTSSSLTVFEAVVWHLHEKGGLTYHEIGELLKRDERNIWTVYHRALKKMGVKEGKRRLP